jgi:pyrroline-5-carboxylate reductase
MATRKKVEARPPAPLAILGGGNMGVSIARGLVAAGRYVPGRIILTRRQPQLLERLAREGFVVQGDNRDAVRKARVVILAVRPQQLTDLLKDISSVVSPARHLIISIVTGVSVDEIRKALRKPARIVRAMPNIAVETRESMTCLASSRVPAEALAETKALFDALGSTVLIEEELMVPATALCACGVAFFLRSIRAASQGGIQIGFHSDDALLMAAQTARGAASLLLSARSHPEGEIDKVTTPSGCTIAGLNEMEHHGFSSAMIMGIVTAAQLATKLFEKRA